MGKGGSNLLVVDDDMSILTVLEARLASAGHHVHTATSAEEALGVIGDNDIELVVSDMKMPGMSGRELLQEILKDKPWIPVILLTAYGNIPDAVEAIRQGAADYLTKPFDGQDLLAKIQTLVAPVRRKGRAGNGQSPLSRVLWGGRSPSMRKLYDLIERVAPSEISVLIFGESGTGKERVAQVIHENSQRNEGPFVVVDCGSTPSGLLESELFGHVKGSFTHAVRDKKGLIEVAEGGTLFLDEIGNISQDMQTRLLRFLQERTIRRIGDTCERTVDCRVLAATNANLPALVKDGTFREDLYFRLKGVTLHVPPLRDRKEDIPLLAEGFVREFSKSNGHESVRIAPETLKLVLSYAWPGNVRELKHALEAGVVLCRDKTLLPEDLQLEQGSSGIGDPADGEALTLEESERRAVIRALEQAGWVQKDAAELLGISRRAIHYKVKKYGIVRPGK